jgi:hypothetical protein
MNIAIVSAWAIVFVALFFLSLGPIERFLRRALKAVQDFRRPIQQALKDTEDKKNHENR